MFRLLVFLSLVVMTIQCCFGTLEQETFINFKPDIPREVALQCIKDNPAVAAENCELKKCISPPYVLIGMDILLNDVDRYFKKHAVQYWMEGATLLGGARFQAFVPWDDDVDVQVFSKSFPAEEIRKEAEAEGYRFVRNPPDTAKPIAFWQIYFTPEKLKAELSKHDVIPKEWLNKIEGHYRQQRDPTPHLDIFLMADNGINISYEHWDHPAVWPRKDIVDPALGEMQVLDKKFPAPYNSLSFLQLYYNTPDIITNAVFATAHNPQCSKGVYLKNLKNYPKLLTYFQDYFRFVFGGRFVSLSDSLLN